MHFQEPNPNYASTDVNNLQELNSALRALPNLQPAALAADLTPADFQVNGTTPTQAEVDQAIADCQEQVYDWEQMGTLIEPVKTKLTTVLAGPAGYDLFTDAGLSAYIDPGGYALQDQAKKLLVAAAHNLGEARHATSKATSPPADANGYVHLYKENAIFAFKDEDAHRGTPKVKVLKQGKVKGEGNHDFS